MYVGRQVGEKSFPEGSVSCSVSAGTTPTGLETIAPPSEKTIVIPSGDQAGSKDSSVVDAVKRLTAPPPSTATV